MPIPAPGQFSLPPPSGTPTGPGTDPPAAGTPAGRNSPFLDLLRALLGGNMESFWQARKARSPWGNWQDGADDDTARTGSLPLPGGRQPFFGYPSQYMEAANNPIYQAGLTPRAPSVRDTVTGATYFAPSMAQEQAAWARRATHGLQSPATPDATAPGAPDVPANPLAVPRDFSYGGYTFTPRGSMDDVLRFLNR